MAGTTPPFEIPEQMRDFADKSVDQARKAFDSFIEASQKAVSTMDGSTNAVQSGARDMNKKALDYAEEHIGAAFALAQNIVRANDVQEIMKLQSEFLKSQMEILGEQAREFSETATKAASDATKPASKS
ncbi:phasin [Breoghania sp. L-A4]|uniref:phasin n=1 Tax=Breoghania sp. L-A4 TaxID=2304600 RepID=UPI000E35F14D|nr:phasin [Breoghania sp. L-A4]AXS39366.1 phasin [Breoghania sp. L-A4]